MERFPGFIIDANGDICVHLGDASCRLMFFIKDKELDNGYHTTIKDYNNNFKNWKYTKPENMLSLKL